MHILEIEPEGTIPGHHRTLILVRLSEDGQTICSWSTEGVGAVEDLEFTAGMVQRGYTRQSRKTPDLHRIDELAKSRGVDTKCSEVVTSLDRLSQLLVDVQGVLLEQRRGGVLTLLSVKKCDLAGVAPIREYLSSRHAVVNADGTASWPEIPGCKNHFWHQQGNLIHVFHRCMHQMFSFLQPDDAELPDTLQACAEFVGVDHSENLTEERVQESLRRSLPKLSETERAGRLSGQDVWTSTEWTENFWKTVQLKERPLGELRADPAYNIATSSGSTGPQKIVLQEEELLDERRDAENAVWSYTEPWFVAIVNRPTNLFAVEGDFDEFRSEETDADLKVTPGNNPTTATPDAWRQVARSIRRSNPTVLAGDAQYLAALTTYLAKGELPKLRQLVVSNHVSWSFQRQLLAEHFGLPAQTLYHSGELSMMATSCRHHSWHLLETFAHYEVFHQSEARLNETGLLLTTTMDSKVRPLVRYPLGDIGHIDDSACPCGDLRRRFVFEGRTTYTLPAKLGGWVTFKAVDDVLSGSRNLSHLALSFRENHIILETVALPGREPIVPIDQLESLTGYPVHVNSSSSLKLLAPGGKLSVFESSTTLTEEHFIKSTEPVSFKR